MRAEIVPVIPGRNTNVFRYMRRPVIITCVITANLGRTEIPAEQLWQLLYIAGTTPPCGGTKRTQTSLNLERHVFYYGICFEFLSIRVWALYDEEPRLGCIISGRLHPKQPDTPRQLHAAAADWLFT